MNRLPLGTTIQALENVYTPTGNIGVITDCISLANHPRRSHENFDYGVLMIGSGHIYLYSNQFTVLAPPVKLQVGLPIKFYHEFKFQIGTIVDVLSWGHYIGVRGENGLFHRIKKEKIIPLRIPTNSNNEFKDMLDI